jgi:hypothetical protein
MAEGSNTRSNNRDAANSSLKNTNLLGAKSSIDRSSIKPSIFGTDTSIPVLEAKGIDFPKLESTQLDAIELLEEKYGEDSKSFPQEIGKARELTRTKAESDRDRRSKDLNSNTQRTREERQNQPSFNYDGQLERTDREIADQRTAIETVSPEAKELLIIKYGEDWETKAPTSDIRKATEMTVSRKAQSEREQRTKNLNSNIQITREERQNQSPVQYERTERSNDVGSSELNSNIETVRIEKELIERQKQLNLLEPSTNSIGISNPTISGTEQKAPLTQEQIIIVQKEANENYQAFRSTSETTDQLDREEVSIETLPPPEQAIQPLSQPEPVQEKPAIQQSVSIVPPDQQTKEIIIQRESEPGDLTGVTPDGKQFTVDKTGRVIYGSPQSSNVVQSPRINATKPETNLQIIKQTENNSLALAEKTLTEYSANKSEFEHEQAKAQLESVNSIKESNLEDEENIKADAILQNQSGPLLSNLIDKGKRSYPNIKESFNTDIGIKMSDPPIWRIALG